METQSGGGPDVGTNPSVGNEKWSQKDWDWESDPTQASVSASCGQDTWVYPQGKMELPRTGRVQAQTDSPAGPEGGDCGGRRASAPTGPPAPAQVQI